MDIYISNWLSCSQLYNQGLHVIQIVESIVLKNSLVLPVTCTHFAFPGPLFVQKGNAKKLTFDNELSWLIVLNKRDMSGKTLILGILEILGYFTFNTSCCRLVERKHPKYTQ